MTAPGYIGRLSRNMVKTQNSKRHIGLYGSGEGLYIILHVFGEIEGGRYTVCLGSRLLIYLRIHVSRSLSTLLTLQLPTYRLDATIRLEAPSLLPRRRHNVRCASEVPKYVSICPS